MASGYNYNPFCFAKVVELIPAESILVNPKSVSLRINEQTNISASVLPTNAIDNTLSWYSDDESIAKVSNSGLITAVSPGLVKIYAASNYNPDVKDFCEVTVVQPVMGIQLADNELELEEDKSIKIQASVLPANATNKDVNWTSSDVSIAMVSPDGTVYAIKPGQATIMATTVDGGFVALCKIKVKAKEIIATSIQISPTSKTIAIGEAIQVNALLEPENVTNVNLNWTSSNPNIATVDSNGLIIAIAEGDAIICASTKDGSNLSATCNISVYNDIILISEIILNPENIEGYENESTTISAVIIPEDATNKQLRWYSSNDDVAVVNDGVVNLVKKGTAIISAEAVDGSNVKSECTVVVSESAGIESIIEDKNTFVKIFNLRGHLIYQGIYVDANIEPGIYIVLYNDKSIKTNIE